jgi:phospholipid transport system transporter-binding protein
VRSECEECQFEDLGEGRFAVRGELGFGTVARILEASKPLFSEHSRIEVDFAGVTRSDSAGLSLLIEWVNWAKFYVREISYENVPQQMRAIAAISEVEWMLSAGSRWTPEAS